MQPSSAGGPDLSSKVHAESGTSPDVRLFASQHHTMGALLRRKNSLEILVAMIFFFFNQLILIRCILPAGNISCCLLITVCLP